MATATVYCVHTKLGATDKVYLIRDQSTGTLIDQRRSLEQAETMALNLLAAGASGDLARVVQVTGTGATRNLVIADCKTKAIAISVGTGDPAELFLAVMA